uniref:hypothetical protein n=1 Tax=Parerythrobacter lutipelagi TaxID=1964208 RepID=UPI0010F9213D|nr:hypothetical protein [Parerythrobacter lutipelagi]
MPDAQQIAADPRWLPHAIDIPGQRMQFLRIEHEHLSATGFLADIMPECDQEAWVSLSEVKAMNPPAGDIHFVFHTAFCRSTLLVRALNVPGVSAGLSEPGILVALVNAGFQQGQPAADLLQPVLRLLARPWAEGEAIFVKPTNHANMLMPALMQGAPQAKALLVTNSLEAFLASVIRKGMMGRRWGRQLYLELQAYAGMDMGMDGREQFALTDLQAAGLAWFLNQRWFTLHAGGQVPGVAADRIRLVDGDRFNEARRKTLLSVLQLANRGAPETAIDKVLEGPIFSKHSKRGGDFADTEASDTVRSSSLVNEEEIAQVAQWIGMIANQAGVRIPARQSLF